MTLQVRRFQHNTLTKRQNITLLVILGVVLEAFAFSSSSNWLPQCLALTASWNAATSAGIRNRIARVSPMQAWYLPRSITQQPHNRFQKYDVSRTGSASFLILQADTSASSIELDASSPSLQFAAMTSSKATKPKSLLGMLHVLWRFTRPHTLVGSAVAIPAIHALAAPSISAFLSMSTLSSILYAMVPALLMNLYITGLNQVTDVSIDKVNKPDLPVAAGDLQMKDAIVIVLVALVLSLAMGMAHPILGSQGLNLALWGSAILGTFYSLPPVRLKRFPLLAALCIVAVRGTIINAGFYAHAKSAAFGESFTSVLYYLLHNRACSLSSLFFGVFGIVIALMKDVPDVIGDEQARVRTFSVRVGQKNVFKWMKRLLTSLFFIFGTGFVKAAWTCNYAPLTLTRMAIATAAFVAGISVNQQAASVNPKDSQNVYDYYMHLWKLFYLSYLALPFAR